ncbi:hypothetical protein INT48_003882 [Thamnidium elegans]|uniref:Up-regulated during septation protein 1 domain-containing protein n=1 Tax=Thamnidium elegans TaxID=101142 RepID=A0A8H7SJG7_9FUNG|nr:hypothetical protein INT48_003882 [Thamnidium elegans]
MIPIMPMQTSDDDRPMGLKFTRTNFFNFPKRDNESLLNGTPSNPQRSTPPLMTRKEEPYHNPSRDSDMSSTSSYQALSPTLPARSPFRIRDSQLAMANKTMGSHDVKSSSSLLDEPPSIYSSVSSSSSTTSSATTDDDLAQELESMWKLKTNVQSKKEPIKQDINSEEMLMQLLISHAMIDAREYKVLTFEEFETLKQHHARLKSRVKNSTSKLELDKKIQETSHSLSNLSSNKNRESVAILLDEAIEADRKVKILSQRLHELKADEIDSQYQILQHTAGVLCLGLQKLETETPTQFDQDKTKIRTELQSITNTLNKILKRYDLNFNNSTLSSTELLTHLERQLEAYKSQSKQFETKLSSVEERYRLESMSEKKLEVQLRAAQSKNQAAETKYSALQKEMNQLLSKVNKPAVDWLPEDDFDFSDDTNIKVEHHRQQQQLETDLSTANQNQQRVERELEMGYVEIAKLKATVSEMELASSKIQSQSAVFQSRETELKKEMEQYRDQVFQLRSQKEKWERTAKRQTMMQQMDNTAPSSSLKEQYEQQLEEQEQEYQAQLKEQAAFLDKTTRQCEKLKEEHEKLSATCQDLELLIRDKTRALDARDIQLSKLESELRQHRSAPNQSGQHGALQQLQVQFSEKEAAWIEQSNIMEADFEGILKEFDRLTGTAMEFETDRRNYEKRIEKLTKEVKVLESNLAEEKTKNLGYEADTPTTASLRKEFRRMINDMKADHQRTLEREGEEKKKLEKQLKDLKHEREMSRYERTNKGVQTLFTP